jgi:hypothetical protein
VRIVDLILVFVFVCTSVYMLDYAVTLVLSELADGCPRD